MNAAADLPVGYQFGDAGRPTREDMLYGARRLFAGALSVPIVTAPTVFVERETGPGMYYGCGKHRATPERERVSYLECPVCHPGAFNTLCTLCRGVNGAHAPECGRKLTLEQKDRMAGLGVRVPESWGPPCYCNGLPVGVDVAQCPAHPQRTLRRGPVGTTN